jgi:hypothetical protein
MIDMLKNACIEVLELGEVWLEDIVPYPKAKK